MKKVKASMMNAIQACCVADGADVQKRWGRLRCAPLVPVMKATNFRNRHDPPCGYFRDRSMIWRVLRESQVRATSMIEVDNSTPIVLTFAKSAIHGTRGSVVPSQCTRCSLSRGSLSAAAAWQPMVQVAFSLTRNKYIDPSRRFRSVTNLNFNDRDRLRREALQRTEHRTERG